MMVGAACSALSGVGGHPALAVAIILVGAGIISQASFWIAQSISRRADRQVAAE
jgi:DHA1 family bicyclomycin/chloramphenicol resistance-like MFS transporter